MALKQGTTSCGGAGLYSHCSSGNILGGTNGLGACTTNADCGTTATPQCLIATPPSAPFAGQVNNASAQKLADIGAGCLNFGSGAGVNVPGGLIPISAFTDFSVTGSGTLTLGPQAGPQTSCSQGGGSLICWNNANFGTPCTTLGTDPICSSVANACQRTANCYFGPPLPIPNPNNVTTNTCVLNVIDTAPSGTANTTTGAISLTLNLRSHVYTTGSLFGTATPCPRCIGGVCNGGARSGLACTVGSPTTQTSVDCLPNTNQWSAPLAIVTPLTTGTAHLAALVNGTFCPGQSTLPKALGGLGVVLGRDLVTTGTPTAGGISGSPHQATLGTPFCIGSVNGVIDAAGGLPGPGVLSLVTDITLLP
jgi:hypothetical protein